MLIVPEALIAGLVSPEDAFRGGRGLLRRDGAGRGLQFSRGARGAGGGAAVRVQVGAGPGGRAAGGEGGRLFPGQHGEGDHQPPVHGASCSTPRPGVPTAMVGGNLLTALRTAAASALSIDRLARRGCARCWAWSGAGHQAGFQLRAAARVREFERVVAWNLHPEMLPKLGRSPPNLACRSRR